MSYARLTALCVAIAAALPAAASAAPNYIAGFTAPADSPGDSIAPRRVLVGADGNLYAIAQPGSGLRLYRYTSATTATSLLAPGGGWFWVDFARDASGAFYFTQNPQGGTHVTKWVEGQQSDTPWGNPTLSDQDGLDALAYSPSDQRTYVGIDGKYGSNGSTNGVSVLDASGTQIKSWLTDEHTQFVSDVTGIALDADGNVYVARTFGSTGNVKMYDHEGTFIRTIGESGDNALSGATGVAIGTDGNVYVPDYGPPFEENGQQRQRANEIKVYKPDGTFVTSWGGPGSAPGSFGFIQGIATDSAGNIVVADSLNKRIDQFNFGQAAPLVGGNNGGGGGDNGGGTGGGSGDTGGGDTGGGGGGGGGGVVLDGSLQGTVTTIAGPVAGAEIEACLANGGGCRLGTTDSQGHYSLTGLPLGSWTVQASPPQPPLGLRSSDHSPFTLAGDAPSATVDLVMPRIEPFFGGAGSPASQGIALKGIVDVTDGGAPVFHSKSPVTLTARGCVGGKGRVKVLVDGAVVNEYPMTAGKEIGKDGKVEYTALIGGLHTYGPALLQIEIKCEIPFHSEFHIYIDPSGFVRTTLGAPVPGATVTLLRTDDASGAFGAVPNGSTIMSPSNRSNPDRSRADGTFGWDVVAGKYKVRVEKAGCFKPGDKKTKFVETPALDIPPAVLNLDLRLACPDKVKPKLSALKVTKRKLTVKVSEASTITARFDRRVRGKFRTARIMKLKAGYGQTLESAVPKSVKAGPYRLTLQATDAAKNKSKPLARKVTVR